MTQFVIDSIPRDGVPVLGLVPRGVPGEGGDLALSQGRLDGRHGVYRDHLFPAGFARVYDQGWHEARGAPHSHRHPNPRGTRHPDDTRAAYAMLPIYGAALAPFAGSTPRPSVLAKAAVKAVARHWAQRGLPPGASNSALQEGCRVGLLIAEALTDDAALEEAVASLVAEGYPCPPRPNPTPAAFPLTAPAYSAPDMAPAAPGVPVYAPSPGPWTLTGQGCMTPYDCAPDEYCHQGLCVPDPWQGTVAGPGGFASGGLPLESHVGITTEGNPPALNSAIGPMALGLRSSGYGAYPGPPGPAPRRLLGHLVP